MRLYDNAYPSTYEEIKTWYPAWYRDVLEMGRTARRDLGRYHSGDR